MKPGTSGQGLKYEPVRSGHGTMGISTSPSSGKLVAQIITGDQPLTDLGPLDPTRFG